MLIALIILVVLITITFEYMPVSPGVLPQLTPIPLQGVEFRFELLNG